MPDARCSSSGTIQLPPRFRSSALPRFFRRNSIAKARKSGGAESDFRRAGEPMAFITVSGVTPSALFAPNQSGAHSASAEPSQAHDHNSNPTSATKMKNWSQQNDDEKAALGGQKSRSGPSGQTPKPGQAQGGGASQPSRGGQRLGQQRDESGQSGQQRVEQRTKRPGEAGLANENRPGLGTRGDSASNPPEGQHDKSSVGQKAPRGQPADQPQPNAGGPAPKPSRPAPNEQRSDSLEQEQQRSTGMSGQSGGV